jgi:hypothetical protein
MEPTTFLVFIPQPKEPVEAVPPVPERNARQSTGENHGDVVHFPLPFGAFTTIIATRSRSMIHSTPSLPVTITIRSPGLCVT